MPQSYYLFISRDLLLTGWNLTFKLLLQICLQASFTCPILLSICPLKPENKTIMLVCLIKCATQVIIYLYLKDKYSQTSLDKWNSYCNFHYHWNNNIFFICFDYWQPVSKMQKYLNVVFFLKRVSSVPYIISNY